MVQPVTLKFLKVAPCSTSCEMWLLQVLQLKDDAGNVVAPFMEDHHKLGLYSPHDGWVMEEEFEAQQHVHRVCTVKHIILLVEPPQWFKVY